MQPSAHRLGIVLVLGAALGSAIAPARAQAPGAATPDSNGAVPPSAAPGPEAVPGGTGVIRPPGGVDPGIDRLPPATGAHGADPMPVYRPPGTPGGDPDVVPK
jgi:hypothetical protein